jgi:16S rRNA (cytosine967-C5)-methyltransferase
MRNEGVLVAHDPSEERLKLVQENVNRLGITIAQVTAAAPVAPAMFDRVLVDAPCSNTGVMRRRVDLRWRIRKEEIERLRLTQAELLKQAAFLVKPGGLLVYSTCSLEPDENREVVASFLSNEKSFALGAERELLPFQDKVDGSYSAVLKLKTEPA